MNVLPTSEYQDLTETSREQYNVSFGGWDSRVACTQFAPLFPLPISIRIPTYDVPRKLDSNPCQSFRAPPLTDRRDSPRLGAVVSACGCISDRKRRVARD
ncbi:hypothetical protein GYMLUDRAFT_418080 [Collybiopsis luxurians FD-317 M1]|uniref:Uncharacterized protein n=1 Tax=Collybiopsis luxurians FD-317 M1 TaxID=944289 RepID=A0A0D0B9H5_9AGAR|nr:hypothetical protein GYMLUDRAFT_418080 [Collybiopsis luxurians FD-317 M1]